MPWVSQVAYGGHHCPSWVVEEHTAVHDSGHRPGHGETMAVMMVIGNANLFPSLLGKSESIAAVIALEMGTAVVGSTHYHALYAAGMVLMLLLFLINSGITLLRSKLEQ